MANWSGYKKFLETDLMKRCSGISDYDADFFANHIAELVQKLNDGDDHENIGRVKRNISNRFDEINEDVANCIMNVGNENINRRWEIKNEF